jgi:hypothetical protein
MVTTVSDNPSVAARKIDPAVHSGVSLESVAGYANQQTQFSIGQSKVARQNLQKGILQGWHIGAYSLWEFHGRPVLAGNLEVPPSVDGVKFGLYPGSAPGATKRTAGINLHERPKGDEVQADRYHEISVIEGTEIRHITARDSDALAYLPIKTGDKNAAGTFTPRTVLNPSGASTFDIKGSLAVPTVSTAVDITLDETHHTVLVDATGANRTITLPTAASATGRLYVVKKIDASANTVTIDPAGAELIDGAATKVLTAQWDSIKFQSNGTSWFIVADKLASSGGSGISVIKEENVAIVNPATSINFDDRDFNVTDEGGGQGLIQTLDKLDIHAWSTPTIITANQTAYAFSGGDSKLSGQRLSSDADHRRIQGILAKPAGFIYILANTAGFIIDVYNEDAGAAAADRIITGTGTFVGLNPGEILMMIYDDTTARWRCWPKVYSASAGAADLTQVEVDLGSFARLSGKFDIVDAALVAGEFIQITQAAGPYTGKGTREDEAEMDGVTAHGYVIGGGGTATVYWNSSRFIKGNVKFNYIHGS